jgi:hypothetical protein
VSAVEPSKIDSSAIKAPNVGRRIHNGGRRPGAGKPRGDVETFRGWCREFTVRPEIRKSLEAAIKTQLEAGETDGYFKVADHGHGRAPQALVIQGPPVNVNILVLQSFQNLPADALEAYVTTGELPAASFDAKPASDTD